MTNVTFKCSHSFEYKALLLFHYFLLSNVVPKCTAVKHYAKRKYDSQLLSSCLLYHRKAEEAGKIYRLVFS